jgi:hypothetical protein
MMDQRITCRPHFLYLLLTFVFCSHFLTASFASSLFASEPPAALKIIAVDNPYDDGTKIKVTVTIPPMSLKDNQSCTYIVERAEEKNGLYSLVGKIKVTSSDRETTDSLTSIKCKMHQDYYFRVQGIDQDEKKSTYLMTASPAQTSRDWFAGSSLKNLIYLLIFCSAIIVFIMLARSGMSLYIRRISGLEAIDEAVGRATEMGKACLFVPGVQDLNDIQTIAGITILSRVTQTAADFDAHVEVPTTRALVMTAAKETMQAAFLMAGKPDGFNQDSVYYVTDEQFGYVAYLTGYMVREKPAACFYFGSFFAESLILAETGNSIGSIQIAGTAQYSQLPFFVAACDYTLIGEELFAASAYLSGSPEELGSLKGQDLGKLVIFFCLIVGTILSQFNPELAELLFK